MSDARRWPEPPVEASIRVGGGARHRLLWTGGELHALDHDEADLVLAALGASPCRCIVIAAGWAEYGADPRLLPYLVDETPSAMGLVGDDDVDAAIEVAAPNVPPEMQSALRQRRLRHLLVGQLTALPYEFRLALARRTVDDLARRDAASLDRSERTAVSHATWLVLRRDVPETRTADLIVTEFAESDTVSGTAKGVRIILRTAWFRDVAAEGRVGEWWREMWSAG